MLLCQMLFRRVNPYYKIGLTTQQKSGTLIPIDIPMVLLLITTYTIVVALRHCKLSTEKRHAQHLKNKK